MCETMASDASVALNPLLNIKLYVDEKDDEMQQNKADKIGRQTCAGATEDVQGRDG